MKKKTTIFLIPLLLAFAGCGGKDDKCTLPKDEDGVSLPDKCYDCQWYATDAPDLSNTDYNTVTDAVKNYTCHRKSLKEHIGDTLRLTGWLYWGNAGTHEWSPEYMTGMINGSIYLTDREDHLGQHQIITVTLNSELKEKFRENYDELLVRKWYVSGILRADDLHTGGCCSYNPSLEAFDFDTINLL